MNFSKKESNDDQKLSPLEQKILSYKKQGHLVPSKKLIKTSEQIEGIRQSGVVNTGVLDMVAEVIQPGMSTLELDDMIYDYTVQHHAIPAPLHYEGYPKSSCISIDEVVCHGIPRKSTVFKEGDIVNVDVSTILNGYFSDASRMFCIGEVSPEKQRLVDVTKKCLEIGAEAVKPFGFVGDIGHAIQTYAESQGYSVVRELCGHGVGLEFHEKPDIEHYGRPGTGMLLVPGMVFTIEPMINMGKRNVEFNMHDGWTVTTRDKKPSAQWEHTFVLTENGLEILTH